MMWKKLAEKYAKFIENPKTITNIQDVFSGFALKACLFLLVVILFLGGGYFLISHMNSKVLSLIEQQRLFQAVAEEIHQVPFEDLASSRFEKKIDDENYVCTVIMDDIFHMPIDMMGETIPGVENPMLTKRKNYIMRSFQIEIMYLPKNLFNLPIDAEPQIIKENFFAVKLADGDYVIRFAEPIRAQYTEQTKIYRENLKRDAEAYIKKRDEQKKREQEAQQQAQ